MPRLSTTTFLISLLFLFLLPTSHAQKPPLTLDEFFNAVYFQSVQISPDGHAVVVETFRADWSANRFRSDLWLYRDDNGGSLIPLTVGGSYVGGDLTNWLITQTTRFRAAVTYAGAVPTSLRGAPWEAEANYNAEAAIWQMGKVTTPTHIVTVTDDTRPIDPEAHLLERALETRGVPHRLLIFPGENHSLARNPWHAKIKVREELKWLEKYGRKK